MKNVYICFSLALILVLSGCTHKDEPLSSVTSSSASQNNYLEADSNASSLESKDVVNLPDELYQVDQSAYAKYLRYDFTVEKKTAMTIKVEVIAGQISFGIKDKDSENYFYDIKEFQTETDSVTLEKGAYSIVLQKIDFTGSYSVKGTPTE